MMVRVLEANASARRFYERPGTANFTTETRQVEAALWFPVRLHWPDLKTVSPS